MGYYTDMESKQTVANRENGKLGGRPTGSISKSRQIANDFKEYVAKRIKAKRKPIIDALIKKSEDGDVAAAKELFDRGFGRTAVPIEDAPPPPPNILTIILQKIDGQTARLECEKSPEIIEGQGVEAQ